MVDGSSRSTNVATSWLVRPGARLGEGAGLLRSTTLSRARRAFDCILRKMGIASTDCFTEPFSSLTAATVFGKSVRNERVGGSQGFGASSCFTRLVRSWLENEGDLLRGSGLLLGFDAGAEGLGAKLLTAAASMRRNLVMMSFHQ